MFLQDRLIKIGSECDHSEESIKSTCLKMFDEIIKETRPLINQPIHTGNIKIIQTFKRLNNTWNKARLELSEKGYPYFAKDGVKITLATNAKYKSIIELI